MQRLAMASVYLLSLRTLDLQCWRNVQGNLFIRKGMYPADGVQGGFYGEHVDIDGDLLVSGAPGDKESGVFNSGAAYVYERADNATWSLSAKSLARAS